VRRCSYTERVQQVLDVPNEVAAELAGIGDGVLGALRERLGCAINLRGNRLTLEGDDDKVVEAKAVLEELVELVEGGQEIGAGTVDTILNAIDQAEDVRDIFEDVVWSHRGKRITPKTVTQKRYVDSIRTSTVTFGIGPAGTGKTYLAIALAVAALSERQVGRIILTRPAVEAGERLGFLPGDVLAKVDPYMRPLFDALYDTMDPERLNTYMERGTIEVAPLAFMRGRAQPLSTPVLTPDGFRPIGSLRVGDLVTSSDGLPTAVLGVYPQGRKQIYRVSTQDGASTLCCGEHLWHVFAPEDRRRDKPGRVLETQEMIGRLRRNPQHRYELPLLSWPAEFEPREVPIDPYAMGLVLGDGGLTTKTTPSYAPHNPQPAMAVQGDGGGVIVVNPVTAAERVLGLAGTHARTLFIPDDYLHNVSGVRIALLQGLLDSDGCSVTQAAGSCRIQFTTRSERLRDDVAFLVRSLGGVVCPGAYDHVLSAMELRLPEQIEPFRLEHKGAQYRRRDGGRPMRFIDSIEPAGEAETVCIQVAAPDSLYVTDDFLLTHNTLNDSFVILDEAQNTSPEQMQMFLTRLGFGSKMVVTGDVTQIDLPREQASGLIQVQDILRSVDGIEFVQFSHQDVVRHKLVQRIVEAYKLHSEETGTARRR
jgi:phosphate starvation-inducible protein PhoH and related proteins